MGVNRRAFAAVWAVIAVVLLLGSIGVGVGLAKGSTPATGPKVEARGEAEHEDADEVESPSYTGSITVNEASYDGMSEADEAAALQKLTSISASDAEKAALQANPGTTATKVELDNENGVVVYSVELSNGLDVKVDAGNGKILHTEQAEETE